MVDVSGDLVVTRWLTIPAGELRWRFSGSGGPGGQHANTSNTKVMLTWNIETSETLTDFQRTRLVSELGPVIRIVAVDERSQTRNRDIALERLRDRGRAALAIRARRRLPAVYLAHVGLRFEPRILSVHQRVHHRDGDRRRLRLGTRQHGTGAARGPAAPGGIAAHEPAGLVCRD